MKKFKAFIISFLIVFLIQFSTALMFALLNRSIFENYEAFFIIPYLIIVLILYFKYYKKLAKKLEITPLLFDIFHLACYAPIWFIVYEISISGEWIFKPICYDGEWFCGLEFLFAPVILIGYIILWFVIKIIILIVKHYKKKSNVN